MRQQTQRHSHGKFINTEVRDLTEVDRDTRLAYAAAYGSISGAMFNGSALEALLKEENRRSRLAKNIFIYICRDELSNCCPQFIIIFILKK